jgi:hypothetical protein
MLEPHWAILRQASALAGRSPEAPADRRLAPGVAPGVRSQNGDWARSLDGANGAETPLPAA